MATDPDAEFVYRAEAILEREFSTRKVTLAEAQSLVNQISYAEDIDPPVIVHIPVSRKYDALAVPSERVIVVQTNQPTQLTIIHEMAHFLGGMNHGVRFRRKYLDLIRRHLSFDHFNFLSSSLE